MAGDVDLHIHSDRSSDGNFSPYHIVQLAKINALRAIAITDHDTVAAYPEVLEYGKEAGVEIVPSLELTTFYDGREFHLLLPFVGWKRGIVKELVSRVAERRFQEARERIQKLQDLGFSLSFEEVLEESGPFPPLGVSIAQTLLKKNEKSGHPGLKKYFEDKNRDSAPYLFYRDYFMEGRPASVPRRNISISEVLEMAPQTAGVPVLAHPGADFQKVAREDLVVLKERGLKGLEVYTSYHNPAQTKFYKGLAEELGLVPTAGSDFHGAIKPHIPFGFLREGGYEMIEELRRRRP